MESPATRPGESWVLWDGVASRLMDTWTGGVVLAGLAVLLDASNLEVGILASLPLLAQVAQLPAVYLMGSVANHKRIVLACSMLARAMLAVVAFLLLAGKLDSGRLVFLLFLSGLLTVISTAAWNSWMRDLLDATRFGRFFAFRMQAATGAAVLALLVAGWYLGETDGRPVSDRYAFVILAGSAAGFVSLMLLARTPHTPSPPVGSNVGALRDMARLYVAPSSWPIILGLGFTSAALSVALPFSGVYLIRSVGMPFVAVTVLALLSQIAYIVGLRVWGRVSDQHGNRGVMQLAVLILAGTLLAWSIQWSSAPGFMWLLAGVHVVSGLAIGGLELTSGNLLLKLAPKGRVASYVAAFSIARAAIGAAATLLAGLLWEALGRGALVTWTWFGATFELRGFHILTLLSTALAVMAFHHLGRIPEPAAGPVPAVAKAVRREAQALSSVGGLRGYGHTATHVVAALHREERKEATPPEGLARRP